MVAVVLNALLATVAISVVLIVCWLVLSLAFGYVLNVYRKRYKPDIVCPECGRVIEEAPETRIDVALNVIDFYAALPWIFLFMKFVYRPVQLQ